MSSEPSKGGECAADMPPTRVEYRRGVPSGRPQGGRRDPDVYPDTGRAGG